MVTYRPAVGLPGCRVGDDGSVWRPLKDGQWKQLKAHIRSDGTVFVNALLGGRHYQVSVACLVLRSFGVHCPPQSQSIHFPDSDPFNNRLSNLRWVPKHFGMHAGPRRYGEKATACKLTESDVLEIRSMAQTGEFYYREIAERFGVTENYVCQLVKGHWRVTSPGPIDSPDVERVLRGETHPNAKLTESDVIRIRELAMTGEFSNIEISELFGINNSTVGLIVNGKSWSHVPVANGDDE